MPVRAISEKYECFFWKYSNLQVIGFVLWSEVAKTVLKYLKHQNIAKLKNRKILALRVTVTLIRWFTLSYTENNTCLQGF